MSQDIQFPDMDENAAAIIDGGRSEARESMAATTAEAFIRDLTKPENLKKLKNELLTEMWVATEAVGYDLDEPLEIMLFVLKAAQRRLASFTEGLADEGFDEYEAKYGRQSETGVVHVSGADLAVRSERLPPSEAGSAEKEAPSTPASSHSGLISTQLISDMNGATSAPPLQPVFVAPHPIPSPISNSQPVFTAPSPVPPPVNNRQPMFVAPPMPPPSAPNRSPAACEPAQSTVVDDDESPEDMLVNRKAQALLTQRLPRSRAEALGMEEARKLVPEVEEAIFDLAIWDLFDTNVVSRANRADPFSLSKFWVCEPDDTVPVSHMRLFEELMAWPVTPGEAPHAALSVPTTAARRGTPSPIPPATAEATKLGSTR